jgi:hypothetical protein
VETLVETAAGSDRWLLSRAFDCRCYAAFGLADGLQRLLCSLAWVGVPLDDDGA